VTRVWIIVAATAAILTAAYTARYGTLNQATYLLDPLHRAMPELFHRDWFVSDTPAYLPAFGWVFSWLFRLDPDGAIAMLVANAVFSLATYAAIYWLVRDVRAFVLVTAFVTVTMGRAMGGSYLLAGYLQPSSVATVGWIIAMAAMVRRRYLVCGLALALAGVIHVNFLVLGIGMFTLAALAQHTAWRDLARLLVPQLLVLAYFLPDLLAASGPSAVAVRILVEFHAPGHYDGHRLVRGIFELAIWQLAAFAVLDDSREARTLWWFSLISFAICATTAVLVLVPALTSLTQVRWSRMAPFGQLAAQVLVALALVRGVPRRRVLAALAIAVAVAETIHFINGSYLAMLLAPAIIFGALAAPWRHASTALAAITLATALWASPRGEGLTTDPVGSPADLALERWAREQTPVDALFLVPPSMGRFRAIARRAVVVDTKSPPLQPEYLVEWYRRLCAVVQLDQAKTHELVEAHWSELSPAQLEAVARASHADYLVVAAGTHLAAPLAYANDEYAVYRY
jgi:hypothetical protein